MDAIKIGNLKPFMFNFELEAIILEYRGSKNDVHEFIISDSTGSISLWLWGMAGKSFSPMQIIRISGCYTKLFRGTISIYLKKDGGRIVRTGEFRLKFCPKPNIGQIQWIPDPEKPNDNKSWIALPADATKEQIMEAQRSRKEVLTQPQPQTQQQPTAIDKVSESFVPTNALVAQLTTLLGQVATNNDPEILHLKSNLSRILSGLISSGLTQAPPPELKDLLTRLTQKLQTPSMNTMPIQPLVLQQQHQQPHLLYPQHRIPIQQSLPNMPQQQQQHFSTIPTGINIHSAGSSLFSSPMVSPVTFNPITQSQHPIAATIHQSQQQFQHNNQRRNFSTSSFQQQQQQQQTILPSNGETQQRNPRTEQASKRRNAYNSDNRGKRKRQKGAPSDSRQKSSEISYDDIDSLPNGGSLSD